MYNASYMMYNFHHGDAPRACNRPFKKDTQTGTRIPHPSTPPGCIPGPIVARIDAATKGGKRCWNVHGNDACKQQVTVKGVPNIYISTTGVEVVAPGTMALSLLAYSVGEEEATSGPSAPRISSSPPQLSGLRHE
jgi:hypothetical protein